MMMMMMMMANSFSNRAVNIVILKKPTEGGNY